MKKISILIASILVLGSFSTRAFAAEANTQAIQTTEAEVSFKGDAGITPDSLLYTIDQAVDKLRVLFATSDEKEAIVTADIAQERLGESEVMAEKGEAELAEQALKEYNENITEAADKLQEAVNNKEAAVEETADEKLEQSIADLEKAIQEVQEKSLVVLDNLKEVIAKDSVDTVEKVIEEQTEHKEAVAKFVAERHEFNAAKKELNMAKVTLKKLEKGGTEAEVKAAQDTLTAAQKDYMTAKGELQAAFQAKKAVDARVDENKEETVAPAEYTKTDNGNGNGSNQQKVEKENNKDEKEKKDKEKIAPEKTEKSNGNRK
jgi:hypothetical protein